jgi:transcription-repair coupling factor (superfamily II helicase)
MNRLVDDIEKTLQQLPKFIRRDVAEAMTSKATPRRFKSFSDRSDTIKVLELATQRGSAEHEALRILLVELILQEMKIRSLERRVNSLETDIFLHA